MAVLMYLRPNTLNKTFDWQQRSTTLNTRSRQSISYTSVGSIIGVLADATPDEQLLYQQMQHPVTHQIVVQFARQANIGDRLVLDGRHFYVQDFVDPGGLGQWTIYKCEERKDV